MSLTLYHGRLDATVSEVVDAGDLLPHFELAALAVLEGEERPGEEPAVRRRFRFEGIRTREHRGALLLDPGELERASSAGLLGGGDEVFLSTVWDDEFEPYHGRVDAQHADLRDPPPLGLADWMAETNCVLAIGDGGALNYATTDHDLHERLQARFRAARR